MPGVNRFTRRYQKLFRVTRGGRESKRQAAAGRLTVEGIPLIVELFEALARGVEPTDGFLLEEVEEARAGMSRRPIRPGVVDRSDYLGLAARVNIEETFREAALRFFAEPSESISANSFGLKGLEVEHRFLIAEIGYRERALIGGQVAGYLPHRWRARDDQIDPFGDFIVN